MHSSPSSHHTPNVSASSALAHMPVAARVAEQICELIVNRGICVGVFLPAERSLAKALNVSRSTVRVALANLVDQGILSTRAGRRAVARYPGKTGHESHSVMHDVIGVMTLDPAQLIPTSGESEGWERYIEVGATEAVARAGRHMLGVYTRHLTDDTCDRLVRTPPAGMIIAGHAQRTRNGRELLEKLHAMKVPVVVYGDEPENRAYDRVTSDHSAGARALTEFLLRRGRQRILRLWPTEQHGWLDARDLGFEEAYRSAHCRPLPPLKIAQFENLTGTPNERFEAKARLLAGYLLEHLNSPEPVDAIVCASDAAVYATARACQILGKNPSQDIDIAGYDNYWGHAEDRSQFPEFKPVATVDKHNRDLGASMVGLLLNRIRGKASEAPCCVRIEPEFIRICT